MNGASDSTLPAIPSLPPIVMPAAEDLLSASDCLSTLDDDVPLSPSRAPPSAKSAHSNSPLSPPSSADDYLDSPHPNGQSLAPPSSLRKSLSVDSFVAHARNGTVGVLGRQTRTNTVGAGSDELRNIPQATALAWQPRTGEAPHVSYQERDARFPLSGRSRGASVSTVDNHSVADDSDDGQIPFGDATRRSGFKGKEKLRQVIPGDLPLPTRLPTLSSPSSISSVSMSSMTTADDTPRLPIISAGSTPRWTGLAGPSSPSGLSRSESLGAIGSNGTGRYLPSFDSKSAMPEVTVAVIGEQGCGKSTAIGKGLKAYRLSEPVAVTDPLRGNDLFGYTLREGKIIHEPQPDCALSVLEVDASVLSDNTGSGGYVWPVGAPRLDGVIVCYDVSRQDSFSHVEDLLRSFRDLKLPIVVFACKCDLERHVESPQVYHRLKQIDVGLVEVTVFHDNGKNQLRLGFDWLLKSIARERRRSFPGVSRPDDQFYQNPASPDVLVSPPPWEISRASTATPTAASSISPNNTFRFTPSSPLASATTPRSPSAPTSPTRARSTSDLLSSDHERTKSRELNRDKTRSTINMGASGNISTGSLQADTTNQSDGLGSVHESVEAPSDSREKDSRPVPWATLEELLDKLLFLAVSGDDWGYISHFLLTYRRFASPRSVVLAMQKRMRQLDQSSADPMFACFAQMRICHLLEVWIHDYPHDFAVGAAADALNALVKSIISKTHLLHYGSDFLPFLEGRPLVDKDAAWALKVDESEDESDESYSYSENEEEPHGLVSSRQNGRKSSSAVPPSARERKSSLPLTAKALVMPEAALAFLSEPTEPRDTSPKAILKDFLKLSTELNAIPAIEIAQEITRVEKRLFLAIEPRHWLVHTLVSGRKEPETDSIARFNELSNHLADWVVSLILCHDRSRNRARQIEKLVEIADKLRSLNNYSALRAFVAGINNASYPGDPAMVMFQQKNPALYKHLQSWDLLLQSARSHRSYRMALRNTKGACIPALEVHLSDLIRAHEGNDDFHPSDPTKIHWAKFNMIGKFIHTTTEFQAHCRDDSYTFKERPEICDLLTRDIVMDPEMQRSRITPPSETDELEERDRPHLPRTMSREYSDRPRDAALIRRLMFWV
ncbi:ras GEF [Artomyces pyxidatus]|uniref:Ras GEF n=1 Tax=Artomyces pyxidatus TaxID=48021 RepID=A0ACB8TIT1_9AGAM|nr:ras GEF [Artomyces pyxidatus]